MTVRTKVYKNTNATPRRFNFYLILNNLEFNLIYFKINILYRRTWLKIYGVNEDRILKAVLSK